MNSRPRVLIICLAFVVLTQSGLRLINGDIGQWTDIGQSSQCSSLWVQQPPGVYNSAANNTILSGGYCNYPLGYFHTTGDLTMNRTDLYFQYSVVQIEGNLISPFADEKWYNVLSLGRSFLFVGGDLVLNTSSLQIKVGGYTNTTTPFVTVNGCVRLNDTSLAVDQSLLLTTVYSQFTFNLINSTCVVGTFKDVTPLYSGCWTFSLTYVPTGVVLAASDDGTCPVWNYYSSDSFKWTVGLSVGGSALVLAIILVTILLLRRFRCITMKFRCSRKNNSSEFTTHEMSETKRSSKSAVRV